MKCQQREMINEVLSLGVPVQFTGDVLARWFDSRRILSLVRKGGDWLVASDCHRMDLRPPVMRAAVDTLEKKLEIQRVRKMLYLADELCGL